MPNLQDVTVRHAGSTDFESLKPLWQALYQHQFDHGMLLELPNGAYEVWVDSIAPFLGRFAVLVVAEREGNPLGFVAGRIRTLPPYFGSATIGAISEVFVSEDHRGNGIGRRLLTAAMSWYRTQQIKRVELQVVAGNEDGVRFYTQLGWHKELLQFVHNVAGPEA
jgi:GNAT superfamily N-acetyltransferase